MCKTGSEINLSLNRVYFLVHTLAKECARHSTDSQSACLANFISDGNQVAKYVIFFTLICVILNCHK